MSKKNYLSFLHIFSYFQETKKYFFLPKQILWPARWVSSFRILKWKYFFYNIEYKNTFLNFSFCSVNRKHFPSFFFYICIGRCIWVGSQKKHVWAALVSAGHCFPFSSTSDHLIRIPFPSVICINWRAALILWSGLVFKRTLRIFLG